MNRTHAHMIQRSIAEDARQSPQVAAMGTVGLLNFLHEQITDAEWRITRARAEIAAYQGAIEAIEAQEKGSRT